jgi:hypothetical protein
MADRSKFEQMLELLINEDKAAAQELFHEIVVEKSRDIYESLLEDEDEIEEDSDEEVSEDDEEVDEAADEEVEESDEDLEEGFSLDEFEVEADDEVGGDATDDMMGDLGMDDEEGDDEEGDEEGEGDVEDRVEDLEDALDDLKAEFEKMMAGEDGEEADGEEADGEEADDMGMDMGDEEEAPEEESFQATVTPLTAGEQMREYVEKVSPKMGDNGANTTSTLAKPNNMGGTSANIAKGATADTKGTAGGLASNKPQAMNTKNVNVVGAKGATKMSSQPGHGAEKKGKPEQAANTKPVVGK